MTRDDILSLSYDELAEMPLEDVLQLTKILGVSMDELYEMILNKSVTAASKRAEKSLNSPLSTTVISSEEIVKSGATTIAEALRLVPGMIVREKTTGNYDVHIRGNDNVPSNNIHVYSENSMTLVMIDNRPVYNYIFGGTFWESLPVEIGDVERIEVVRGPSSALYGPNAITGAINIVTKQTESDKLSLEVNAQGGTSKSAIADMSVAGGKNDFHFRVSGNYTHFNRTDEDFYIEAFGKKFKYDEVDTLHYYINPSQSQMLVLGDATKGKRIEDRILNEDLATNKFGANAFFDYKINDKVKFDLSAGLQGSTILTNCLGASDLVLTNRIISSQYVNLTANVYGFAIQANTLFGDMDMEHNNMGYRADANLSNVSLEYEHSFGSLVVRPGISWQKAIYDDTDYIPDSLLGQGFLNQKRDISSYSGSLRLDYKAFDKLRLIAALRAEKYTHPDDIYFTYQFVSSFDINENNILRTVYSRANRGPFVVDTYANFVWPRVHDDNPYGYTPTDVTWYGNDNLKLPVMDMVEIGFRSKPVKNLMIDIEAFYTKTQDYSYFLADTLQTTFNFLTQASTYNKINMQYYNFDLVTKQKGITASANMVIGPNLSFKVFGTLQETKVENFHNCSLWDDIANMTESATGKVYSDAVILGTYQQCVANGLDINDMVIAGYLTVEQAQRLGEIEANGYQSTYVVTNTSMENGQVIDSTTIDTYNKSTPTFYGGGTIDYSPMEKLFISSSFYFYTKNELRSISYTEDKAAGAEWMFKNDPKFILNLKVGYKFYKDNVVYVNARNLLNSDKREAGYTDKIKGLYLIGLNLKF